MFINWSGNNLTTNYAKYLPEYFATSNAGLNGLSLNFFCSYSFIFVVVNMSFTEPPINFIKFLIESLYHWSA